MVIVFDPKADADLMKRVAAEARRAGNARGLSLAPRPTAQAQPVRQAGRGDPSVFVLAAVRHAWQHPVRMGVYVVLWPDEGPAHSVAMVEDELRGLESNFSEGIFIRRPALFAREMAAAVNAKVYQDWRLDGKAVELDRRTGFRRMPTNSRRGSKTISWAAVAATEVYAIRLAVMVSALAKVPAVRGSRRGGRAGAARLAALRRRFGGGREKG